MPVFICMYPGIKRQSEQVVVIAIDFVRFLLYSLVVEIFSFPPTVTKINNLLEPKDVRIGSTNSTRGVLGMMLRGVIPTSPVWFPASCILTIEYTAPCICHWLSAYTSSCKTTPNHTGCCPQTN